MAQNPAERLSEPAETDEDSLYAELRRFFFDEAALLDDRRFDAWLDLLTDDVIYRVPARETTAEGGESELIDMDHIHANRFRLEKRIERLSTEHAWAERPPSRTRHFISNLRILNHDPEDGTASTRCNLLVHVNRGDDPESVRLSAERRDDLVREDGEWRIDERVVFLDHATLPIGQLSVFL